MLPSAPWNEHPLLVLVPVVAAGAVLVGLRRPLRPDAPPRPLLELLLVLLSAVVLPVVLWQWTSCFLVPRGGALGPDFTDYCSAIIAHSPDHGGPQPMARSPLIARMLGMAEPYLGLIDTLHLGALCGTGMVGAGTYLWGRSATGHPAGGATAVALVGTVVPLLLLPRHLTFYPLLAGTAALATGLVALAATLGRPTAFGAAGCAIGLALCTDNRLLPISLMLLAIAGLATVMGPWKQLPLRLLALVLPVAASWPIASRVAVGPGGGGIIATQSGYVGLLGGLLIDHDPTVLEEMHRWETRGDLAWGFSHWNEVGVALERLKWLSGVPRSERLLGADVLAAGTGDSWFVAATVICLALAAAFAWRTPRRAFVLTLLPAPFLVLVAGAVQLLPTPRAMAVGSLVFPVAFAAGLWTFAQVQRLPPAGPWIAAALVWALTLGLPPTVLGPQALWRKVPVPSIVRQASELEWTQPSQPHASPCTRVAEEEQAAEGGIRWLGPLRGVR